VSLREIAEGNLDDAGRTEISADLPSVARERYTDPGAGSSKLPAVIWLRLAHQSGEIAEWGRDDREPHPCGGRQPGCHAR
jgi:hypothetical protein